MPKPTKRIVPKGVNMEGKPEFGSNLNELLYNDLWIIEAEREVRGESFVNPEELKRLTEYIAENGRIYKYA